MSVVTLFSPELQIIFLGTVSNVSSPTVNKPQAPTNATRIVDVKPRITEHMDGSRTTHRCNHDL
jgi:hypothetical protein